MTPEDKPKLRPDLDIVPAMAGKQQVLLIRDPLGLVKQPVVLSLEALPILSLLDGKQTLSDIKLALVRRSGGLLNILGEAERLVRYLEDACLLDTDRFRQARAGLVREFGRRQVRDPAIAGSSYPEEPTELRRFIDAVLSDHDQPPAESLLALAVPHIDLSVGKKGYAAAYRAIGGRAPSLVIILGTGHSMGGEAFCPTAKDFRTPLGTVETDREAVEKIRQAGGGSVAPDDFPHRREHSIEFQVLFLLRLFGARTFRIVPILCGSFAPFLREYRRPAEVPGIGAVLGALRDLAGRAGGDCLIVAGVDLSHVGPKFGHEAPASAIVPESQAHDRALLESLCRQDVEGFWAESRRVADRYHVCGFSALACLMEILPPCRGTLLHYDVWHEDATRSAVSFAAVAFQSLPAVRGAADRPGPNGSSEREDVEPAD